MREIKFRAWNGEDMIYSETGGWCSFMDAVDPGYKYSHNYDLMQFTGLKDKNGKEIYEGDIILYNDCYADGYNSGVYSVVYLQSRAKFCLLQGLQHEVAKNLLAKRQNWYEIIGNIYENPKLIKEKDQTV